MDGAANKMKHPRTVRVALLIGSRPCNIAMPSAAKTATPTAVASDPVVMLAIQAKVLAKLEF